LIGNLNQELSNQVENLLSKKVSEIHSELIKNQLLLSIPKDLERFSLASKWLRRILKKNDHLIIANSTERKLLQNGSRS
jgi:predicted DNA-binding protein